MDEDDALASYMSQYAPPTGNEYTSFYLANQEPDYGMTLLGDDYTVTQYGTVLSRSGEEGKFDSSGNFVPFTSMGREGAQQYAAPRLAESKMPGILDLFKKGDIGGGLKSLAGAGLDFAKSKAGMAALMALLAALDRKKSTPASGGGVAQAYVSPTSAPQQRIIQGPYGPIAQYYAGGGPVAMEDGGFVMTKRAVDGAGGPDGIRQLIPGARPIRGPGTGTSDSIPAYIEGKDGRTPAKVSNGEAYVPKDTVDRLGGAARMYAMMHKLQRRG